jgi:hypothetical protein
MNMSKRKSIKVAGGFADYLTTETEDDRGHWNDSYKIKEGFWVTHEGKQHHVYKQRRR